MTAAENEELQFLRDQVARLNSQLSSYQQNTDHGNTNGDVTILNHSAASIITDHVNLPPLILQYDVTIEQLTAEVDRYKNELSELRECYDEYVNNTEYNFTKCKEAIDNLHAVDFNFQQDENVRANFLEQLKLITNERDANQRLYEDTLRQNDSLKEQVRILKMSPESMALNIQAAELEQKYEQVKSSLESEKRLAVDELAALKNENEMLKKNSDEYRQHLASVNAEAWKKEEEVNNLVVRNELSGKVVTDIQGIVFDLQKRLNSSERLFEQLQKEKRVTEDKLSEMQKSCEHYNNKHYEACIQVRDIMSHFETIDLEKNNALTLLAQKKEDCERLQQAMNTIINESAEKAREEVDSVRRMANERIDQLIEQLNQSEIEKSDKMAELERTKRYAKNVEAEIERINTDNERRIAKETIENEDLNRRLLSAEREREELSLQLDSNKSAFVRQEINWKKEKKQYKAECVHLNERLAELNNSLEKCNEDRLINSDKLEDQEQVIAQVKKDMEKLSRKQQQEVQLIHHQYQLREKEHQMKMSAMNDASRQSVNDMRQMFTAQQRINAQLKEEYEDVTKKFEENATRMRVEISSLKDRIDDLTSHLTATKKKLAEKDRSAVDYRQKIKRLEQRNQEIQEMHFAAANSSHHRKRQHKPPAEIGAN